MNERRRSSRNVLSLLHRRGGGGGGDTSNSNPQHRIPLKPSSWTKLYEKKHDPCPRHQYTELVFDEPVRIRPGELRALYIHSTLPGDKAIVYDNSYYGDSDKRFEDDKLVILSGRAHVSNTCFGQDPIWCVSYCIYHVLYRIVSYRIVSYQYGPKIAQQI
jgi:hypothetical protein